MMLIPDSSRLRYRLMNSNDSELLFQLDQDPQVMRYINGGQASSREKIATVFIPRMEAYRDTEKGWGLWQVSLKESDAYLGWLLVRPMNFFSDAPEFDNLELGWRFFQAAWGQGYASEAAQHIKQHLATNKAYRAFSAIADQANSASIGVMKKIGMSYLKSYRHIDPLFECDVVYYQFSNA